MLLKQSMNVSLSEAPALLNTALQRLAAQSAACKLWSIVLTSSLLGLSLGRGTADSLLWAAVPVLLLSLADAAYLVQSRRIADLALKESVRAEDLFRMQAGSAGFAASFKSLGGLASFSVWPFYASLIATVLVLGQTAQPSATRPQFPAQTSPIAASPFQLNNARPASFTPSKGTPPFHPPTSQTLSRPSMPPTMGPSSRPNFPGTAIKSPAVPKGAAPMSRPATSTLAPRPQSTLPTSNTSQNASAKPVTGQTQPPK